MSEIDLNNVDEDALLEQVEDYELRNPEELRDTTGKLENTITTLIGGLEKNLLGKFEELKERVGSLESRMSSLEKRSFTRFEQTCDLMDRMLPRVSDAILAQRLCERRVYNLLVRMEEQRPLDSPGRRTFEVERKRRIVRGEDRLSRTPLKLPRKSQASLGKIIVSSPPHAKNRKGEKDPTSEASSIALSP